MLQFVSTAPSQMRTVSINDDLSNKIEVHAVRFGNPNRNWSLTFLIVLALGSLFVCDNDARAEDKIRGSVNEFEGARMAARMWVALEQLQLSELTPPCTDEQQFAQLWEDVGKAAAKVEAAWQRAIEEDPLIEKALECLDRSNDLSVPYNQLRITMRKRHGNDGFRKLEKEGNEWHQYSSMKWLDLNNRELIRLWLRVGQIMNPVAPKNKTGDDGHEVSLKPYEWLTNAFPSDEFIGNVDEVVTEEDAIKVWVDGLEKFRAYCREERDRLRQSLELPEEMWLYLPIRQESDSLGTLGFTYLKVQLPQVHPDIAEAEQHFIELYRQAQELCPSLTRALASVHQSQLKQDEERLKNLHEQLLLPVTKAGP